MTGPASPARLIMTVDAVGGVWRYAMDLSRELTRAGFSIVFAGLGPKPSLALLEEAASIGTLHWLDTPLDWMATGPDDLSRLPDELARLVKQEKADLLHINLPSQAANLRVDLPVVTVSHSCPVTWFKAVRGEIPDDWRWHEDINRAGLQQSDAVVSPSASHANALISAYGERKISVVPNASTLPPRRYGKRDMVFAAGRWWDDGKNGAVLDAAAAASLWPVTLVGPTEGPNGESIAFAHAETRGSLSHQETMALMQEAGVFVSPSLYEPFGLAALEAARSGAAMILSDIPTYRELWSDAALFFDPRDPEALARAINRLTVDPALREKLGAEALERSRAFTVERQAAAMMVIYGQALARAGRRQAAE